MKVMPVDKDYTVNNLNETLMQVEFYSILTRLKRRLLA